MTKAQALREAQKRWGRRAIIEHRPKALLEAAKLPLRARHKEVKAELAGMVRAPAFGPLPPDFHDRRRALLREERELFGKLIGDRCSVGDRMDILNAFHVKGSGDTWEQAFAKADEHYPTRKVAP